MREVNRYREIEERGGEYTLHTNTNILINYFLQKFTMI